jgi:hypothetical protein
MLLEPHVLVKMFFFFYPNTVLLSLLTPLFSDIYFCIRNLFLFDVISYLFSSHDVLRSHAGQIFSRIIYYLFQSSHFICIVKLYYKR